MQDFIPRSTDRSDYLRKKYAAQERAELIAHIDKNIQRGRSFDPVALADDVQSDRVRRPGRFSSQAEHERFAAYVQGLNELVEERRESLREK